MTCSVHVGGLVHGLGIVYYYTPVVEQTDTGAVFVEVK